VVVPIRDEKGFWRLLSIAFFLVAVAYALALVLVMGGVSLDDTLAGASGLPFAASLLHGLGFILASASALALARGPDAPVRRTLAVYALALYLLVLGFELLLAFSLAPRDDRRFVETGLRAALNLLPVAAVLLLGLAPGVGRWEGSALGVATGFGGVAVLVDLATIVRDVPEPATKAVLAVFWLFASAYFWIPSPAVRRPSR
jgi:hypothetical protein